MQERRFESLAQEFGAAEGAAVPTRTAIRWYFAGATPFRGAARVQSNDTSQEGIGSPRNFSLPC
jgi:hypothetical protein